MSDDFDPNEFLSEAGPNDGGKLRQLLEQTLKQNKELSAKVEAFQTQAAERALTDTWSKLEVPAAIQKLYNGDKNPQAVEAWWNESKSLFNLQGAETESQQLPTPEQTEQQNQLAAVTQASSIGHDVTFSGLDALQRQRQELQGKSALKNPEALDAFIASLGGGPGHLTVPRLQ